MSREIAVNLAKNKNTRKKVKKKNCTQKQAGDK